MSTTTIHYEGPQEAEQFNTRYYLPSELQYSQDELLAVIRDFFAFLTDMYMDESMILEPPAGGWPAVTADDPVVKGLGKSEAVISLMRHLPCIGTRRMNDTQVTPNCKWFSWAESIIPRSEQYPVNPEDLRLFTEGCEIYQTTQPDLLGLTDMIVDGPGILVDTKHGAIMWYNVSEKRVESLPFSPVRYSYEPWDDRTSQEDEASEENEDSEADDEEEGKAENANNVENDESINNNEWRNSVLAYRICDFFEVVKELYRRLDFVPISPWTVLQANKPWLGDEHPAFPAIRQIYRDHGWPNDMERYRKKECLKAVHEAMLRLAPGLAEPQPWDSFG